MADGYRNNAAVDASALYDPDVMGDGYNATFLRRTDGTTLKYALAAYGTPGPVLGYRDASGNDAGPKWAAKGTASYGLPIQGVRYTQNTVISHSSSGFASLTFSANASTWAVTGAGSGSLTPAAGTRASGAIPSGAATVKYQASISAGSGGTVTNGAPGATAIGSNPQIVVTQSGTGTGAGNDVSYLMTVTFYNSVGAAISNTTFTFEVSYEGSA